MPAMDALEILKNDLLSPNPLIRALSLRTLSTVHVREYVEDLLEPIDALLEDTDPYVRKTAALAVAKMHGHDKKTIEQTKLVDRLCNLLSDSNSNVHCAFH